MTAEQLGTSLLLLAAGLMALYGMWLALPRTKLALGAFLFGIAFLPIWLGGQISSLISVHMALAGILLVSLLLARPPELSARLDPAGGGGTAGLQAFDVVMLLLAMLAVTTYVANVVNIGQVYLIAVWGLMYAVGRLAAVRLGLATIATMVTWLFAVVAVLAIIEFASGQNVWLMFTANSTSAFGIWGPQQYRGSFVRAEGAFGHSIALGLSLAIAIALVPAARMRTWLKLTFIALMSVAVILTFSRAAFVSTGLVLALLALRSGKSVARSMRVGLGLVLLVAIPVGLLATSDAFAEGGDLSTDAALYRFWLWDLVPALRPVGQSSLMIRATDGSSSVGNFTSIDSAVLLHSLSNGWVPALILVIACTVAAIRLMVRGGNLALIALVAQMPAFFSVALITQYAHLLWFVAGIAVSGFAVSHSSRAAPPERVSSAEERRPALSA